MGKVGRKLANHIGERFKTNEGYWGTIIEYRSYKDCDFRFDDGHITKNLMCGNIIKGNVKNPYHPSVFGIGYLGQGRHKSKVDGSHTKVYISWSNMMMRCYSEIYQKRQPSYIGCSVHPDWLNFQVFADWYEYHYKEGYQLDKDILIKGNKIYSPNTCCFVPQEINSLFVNCKRLRGEYPIGVNKEGKKFLSQINSKRISLFDTPEEAFQAYKKAKEIEIKEVAEVNKSIIPERVYKALYNYQVEITD